MKTLVECIPSPCLVSIKYVVFTCCFHRALIGHMNIISAGLEAVNLVRGGTGLDIGAAKLNAPRVVFQEPAVKMCIIPRHR